MTRDVAPIVAGAIRVESVTNDRVGVGDAISPAPVHGRGADARANFKPVIPSHRRPAAIATVDVERRLDSGRVAYRGANGRRRAKEGRAGPCGNSLLRRSALGNARAPAVLARAKAGG